jgi:hypothetical protein
MVRYYFSVTNGRPFNNTDGLELPDLESARAEAVGFARDLMRMEPARQDWSSWVIQVTDERQRVVFNLAFTEVIKAYR